MTDRDGRHRDSVTERFAATGTIAVISGAILLVARGIETARGIPGLPRFWYESDALWWAIGAMIFGAGSWLLMNAEPRDTSKWKPAVAGRRFRQLLLYTRDGCHLCDQAGELLAHYSRWLPAVTNIDIDSDPQLVEQYGTCVPVVAIDGKVRFRGRVDEELLRRLIEGTPPIEFG